MPPVASNICHVPDQHSVLCGLPTIWNTANYPGSPVGNFNPYFLAFILCPPWVDCWKLQKPSQMFQSICRGFTKLDQRISEQQTTNKFQGSAGWRQIRCSLRTRIGLFKKKLPSIYVHPPQQTNESNKCIILFGYMCWSNSSLSWVTYSECNKKSNLWLVFHSNTLHLTYNWRDNFAFQEQREEQC